jgi:ABC-type branched-subunit amino acid transport system permease subunit
MALILLLLALPFLPGVGRYPIDLATSVLIYVLLGLGLTVVVGWAGLLDLGLCRLLRAGRLWLRAGQPAVGAVVLGGDCRSAR